MYVFGSGRRRRRGGEWMRELGLGITNPVGTGGGGCWTCVCVWVAVCMWGVGRGFGTRVWKGGVMLYMREL